MFRRAAGAAGGPMIRRKIGLKLTLAASLTALLTISIFAYFNIRSHDRSLLEEVAAALPMHEHAQKMEQWAREAANAEYRAREEAQEMLDAFGF